MNGVKGVMKLDADMSFRQLFWLEHGISRRRLFRIQVPQSGMCGGQSMIIGVFSGFSTFAKIHSTNPLTVLVPFSPFTPFYFSFNRLISPS